MAGYIPCFVVTPTAEAVRSLRRYVAGRQDCPGPYKFHNASVDIGREPFPENRVVIFEGEADLGIVNGFQDTEFEAADRRWPKVCAGCSYEFNWHDQWQCNVTRLFAGGPSESTWIGTLREAPPGAIWEATWLGKNYRGPDGRSIVVKLPDGTDWIVDAETAQGGRWTRTGEIPRISVTPSVDTGRYHGFLRDGMITADLEGRIYSLVEFR